MTTIHWPADEWARVKELHAQGLSAVEISKIVKRSSNGIRDKIRWESLTIEQREMRREKINANRRTARRNDPQKHARIHPQRMLTEKAPDFVLEQRALRYATQPRDLTASFFNDPLPGFSALERRGA